MPIRPVIAVILFILVGIAALVGGFGSTGPNASVLGGGKVFPAGFGAVLATIPIVIVAFYGSEVATIAAAESSEPQENVKRVTNTIVIRIVLFYLLSLLLVVLFVPWNNAEAMASPFASALSAMGIPGAKTAMNIVVLTALMSCLNAGIYASSRMAFALAKRGDAPKQILKLSKRGAPIRAVALVTSGGYFAVIMDAIFPHKTVFFFLINSAGAVAVLVYLVIVLSHLRMRRELDKDETAVDRVRMPGFPVINYLTVGVMLAIFFGMGIKPETRPQLLFTIGTLGVVLSIYGIRKLVRRRKARSDDLPVASEVELGWSATKLTDPVVAPETIYAGPASTASAVSQSAPVDAPASLGGATAPPPTEVFK